MPKDTKKTANAVPLRLLVSEEFKSRLKAQAGRMNVTMGELVESLATERLQELEIKALEQLKPGKAV